MVMSGKKCPKCGVELVKGASYCQRCGTRIFENDFGDLSSDPYIGTIIDDTFEIQSILGTGSMGIVYKAHHRALNCPVAIKILRHDFLNDRVVQTRFQREAQAASSLSHPNIIQIYHYGRTALNAPYIAMECLNGKELSSLIPEQFPLSPKRVCHIASQTAHALSAAHHANIIHRDLKPANIVVTNRCHDDFVKVLDFGIAKIADVEGEGLTREGAICGTPAFMSPEQVLGRNITPQSDIFSLGSTLYYMLTCRLPFHGDSLVDMSRSVLSLNPTPPSQARIDCYVAPELESICLKALEKDPADRFESADEMAVALDRLYSQLPDDTSNIKPKIVIQSTDCAAIEDLSGATACIKAYDEDDEDDEAGTVVEMPAFPSEPSMSSVHSTHTNTDSPAMKNPIVYAVSQVLDVINPNATPESNSLLMTPTNDEEVVKSRKRFLLGIVCIVVGACLLLVIVISLTVFALRPSTSDSGKQSAEESNKEAAAVAEDFEKRPSLDTLMKVDTVVASIQAGMTYATAYGSLCLADEDRARVAADSGDADDNGGEVGDEGDADAVEAANVEQAPKPAPKPTVAKTTKPAQKSGSTAKKTTKPAQKSGSTAKKTTKSNASKSSASKNQGRGKVSYASQIAQAEKLEKQGDKVKACSIYRQILRGEGISQSEKLKVQAKIRNCGRISI